MFVSLTLFVLASFDKKLRTSVTIKQAKNNVSTDR